ncbi:hypothetical protein L4D06_00860 [Enterovibrio makurazakiensis]|uniref:FimV/HubP family polar landmark protein n=1 Tax=Enterovibrio makurazakiensis TaxID=2910232 RepID=UPI003D257D7D
MRAVSDADFYNTMKQTLFSSQASRRFGKLLAVSTLLLSLAATFSVHSAIRILGPVDESPAPSTVTPLSQANQTASTANRRQSVGPTRDNDTLWSIAKRNQPNTAVSVYQTVGAIFRLNPNAFEDQNIHGLIPGSTLLMPTLTEIRRESTDDVAQRLQIDQRRKDAQRGINRQPLSQQAAATAQQPAQPEMTASSEKAKPVKAPEKMTKPDVPKKPEMADMDASSKSDMAMEDGDSMGADMTPPKPNMGSVQDQIDESDLQMGKLVESNHILKIRLAEVQNELSVLKEQMTGDEALTEEIKSFLEAQKMRQAQMEMKEPSFIESLMASPLMLATVAIIPALLVIGTAAFIIMRRRKKDDDIEEPEGLDGEEPDLPVIMVPDVEGDDDELVLEDDELEVTDDTDADDLFGDEGIFDSELDDINLSDSLELSDEPTESGLDIDGDSDFGTDTDLDAMLDDDFSASTELNVEASTDGAIGLEDMERALDEMASQPEESELSPDEALAAMWEQSLSGGDDADVDDIDALLNATQSADDEPAANEPAANEQSAADDAIAEAEAAFAAAAAEDDDADITNEALFDKVLDDEPEVDLSQDINLSDDDLDDILNQAQEEKPNENPEDDSLEEDSLEEDSTALLDEFLDEAVNVDDIDNILSETGSDNDVQLDGTDALLDELLDDDALDEDGNPIEPQEADDTDLLSIDADIDTDDISDTDALLDEFVGDDEDLLDETALLDEAIDDDDLLEDLVGEPSDDENVDLGDTDVLLDELVADDGDIEDESALLEEASDDDLLGDELISLDDDLALDDVEIQATDDADSAVVDENLLQPSIEEEALEELAENDVEDAVDGVNADAEDIEQAQESESDAEASESDMDLLDSLLDDGESATDIEAVPAFDASLDSLEALDAEEKEIPEATQSDIDLLDSLLGQDDEASASSELDAAEPTEISSSDEQPLTGDDNLAGDADESVEEEPLVSSEDEADLDDAFAAIESMPDELNEAPTQDDAETAFEELETEEIVTEPFAGGDTGVEGLEQQEAETEEAEGKEVEAQEVEAQEINAQEIKAEPLEEQLTAEQVQDDASEETSEEAAFEEDAPLDLSSLPEYDEEAALADSDFEEIEPGEPVEAGKEDSSFDLSDLPEYTEEDAAVDFDTPSAIEPESVSDTESEESAIEAAEKEAAEKEEPEPKETAGQQVDTSELDEEAEESTFTATENNTLAFPSVDPISLDDLGEFDEDDALGAALDEQRELDEAVPESERSQFSQASAAVSQAPYRATELNDIAELEDDAHQVAGLNMEALLSEPLDDDQMGLGDFQTMTAETAEADEANDVLTSLDAADDVEDQDESFHLDDELEEPDDLDIPDDESGIWHAEQTPEPELESEDWSQQPEILGDEIKSMDLEADLEGLLEDAESELVEATSTGDGFISIDELMKDDGVPQADPDSVTMDLDVGLEDFPDVLSDIQPVDVDSNGEAATNMDLAKAYLEMNDIDGAIQLLEQVMQGDDSTLKEEARVMIEKLH